MNENRLSVVIFTIPTGGCTTLGLEIFVLCDVPIELF
jgi:hypothetical protein